MFPKVFAIFGYQKVVNLHKRQPFGDARCVRKDKQAHRRTDRQKEGKMEICISIQKLRQTNKQTDGQTKRWKDSPGNNNIDSSPIWYYQLHTSKGNPKKSGQQTDKHTCSQGWTPGLDRTGKTRVIHKIANPGNSNENPVPVPVPDFFRGSLYTEL